MSSLHQYIIMLAAATLIACSNAEEPSVIPPQAVYDIVTLTSTGSKGSTFTMRVNGDSPEIIYTGPYDFNKVEHIVPGMRILISYNRIDGATHTSGEIKIYGYSAMSNVRQDMEVTDFDGKAPEMRPLEMSAIWRTGQFINVRASLLVYKAQRPESYILVADKSTLDSQCPKLYLIYSNKSDNNGDNPYQTNASFDISQVWHREDITGVEVCFNTPSGPQSVIFNK